MYVKKITQFLAVFPLILFVIIEITIIKNSIDSVKLKNEIPRKIPNVPPILASKETKSSLSDSVESVYD